MKIINHVILLIKMNKLKLFLIFMSIILSSCSFNEKKNVDIIEYEIFKIKEIEGEYKNISKINGRKKASLSYIKKDKEVFFDWWIESEFSDGLVKNTVLFLPMKIKFGGENNFLIKIDLKNNYYNKIDVAIKRWLNTFKMISVENEFYAIKENIVEDEKIILRVGLPSSIFLPNNIKKIGLCEIKSKKYVLKSGVCNFKEIDSVNIEKGNLIMEINNSTEYGVLYHEKEISFPLLKIKDVKNVLIWKNKYLIFGENYENITFLNKEDKSNE